MPDLLVEREGPVVTLTMNRPERRNAMTLAMFARLADAWDEIDTVLITTIHGVLTNINSNESKTDLIPNVMVSKTFSPLRTA